MMKKYYTLIIAALMILAAGCGKEATVPGVQTPGSEVPKIVVGEVQKQSAEVVEEENNVEENNVEENIEEENIEEENNVSEGSSIDAQLFEGDFSGVPAEGMKEGISFNVENKTREMKDEEGDVYFTGEYQIPSVEIKDNAPAEAAVNEYLAEGVVSFETNMDLMAAEAASFIDVVKDDENYDPDNDGAFSASYEMISAMEATRLDSAVISLHESSYSFTGGAHGMHAFTGYNFDTKTGKLLTLSGIAQDTSAFKESAKKYIITACRTMEGAEDLFPEYEESVDDIFAEGNWYFTDNGVVFIAQEYLIGPYSMGIMQFEVPYNMLDSMNPAYVR